MKTGDAVRDGHGKTWQIGQLLGRGTWGRSYTVRGEHPSDEAVIKVPYSAADLGGDEALATACRDILIEQARWQAEGKLPGTVPVLDRFVLPDGRPALLMPKKGQSFERRTGQSLSTEEILNIGLNVLARLQELSAHVQVHGNLKPGNVLITDTGEVLLADAVTPHFRRYQAELRAVIGGDSTFSAPEVREPTRSPLPLSVPADTYSVGMLMVLALGTGTERFPDLPVDGIDKQRLVTLRDRLINRLKKEPSNPRFHTRMAERLSAVLSRALSRETSPSPPFRFKSLDDMRKRLEDVHALIRPGIAQVGRFNLDLKPGSEAFTTEDTVNFSVSIACTPGVESHDEISCGIALFDADRDERLRNADCSYTVDRHPTGRFRFGFRVTSLAPGAYRARVAFRIRDAQEEPQTVDGQFHVRAAPGYVPPRQTPSPTPLPLERDELSQATEPGRRGPTPPKPLIRPADPRPSAIAADLPSPIPPTAPPPAPPPPAPPAPVPHTGALPPRPDELATTQLRFDPPSSARPSRPFDLDTGAARAPQAPAHPPTPMVGGRVAPPPAAPAPALSPPTGSGRLGPTPPIQPDRAGPLAAPGQHASSGPPFGQAQGPRTSPGALPGAAGAQAGGGFGTGPATSPGRATGPISPIAMQGSKTAGRGTVLPSAAAQRPDPTEPGTGPWSPSRPPPAGPERPGWQRTAQEERPSSTDRTVPSVARPGERSRAPEPPRAPEPERPAPLRIQPPGAAPAQPAVRIAADPAGPRGNDPRFPEPRAAEARPVDPHSAGGRPSGAGRADERRSPPPAPVIVLPPGRSPPSPRPTDPGRRELDRGSDAGVDRSSAWDDPADSSLSWGPMPEADGEDLLPDPQSAPMRPTANPLIDAPEDNGPVARLIYKAYAAISGDSYVMLLIIGAAAITVLALVLLVAK